MRSVLSAYHDLLAIDDVEALCRLSYTLTVQVIIMFNVRCCPLNIADACSSVTAANADDEVRSSISRCGRSIEFKIATMGRQGAAHGAGEDTIHQDIASLAVVGNGIVSINALELAGKSAGDDVG